jgi:type I restriction-modification system DNA methylase subunit
VYGVDFVFSKTNKTLVSIREYLMKTCDLQEIIYMPSGIFTYTSIKTCVAFFIKKKEGAEVLQTNVEFSKTQKEKARQYKFVDAHQTHCVKFYDWNPDADTKTLLVKVPIQELE